MANDGLIDPYPGDGGRAEHPQPATLQGFLLRAGREYPQHYIRYAGPSGAGQDVDQRYPELLDAARRYLTGLRDLHLRPGVKVLLLFEQLQETVPLFWACILGGFVPCVLPPLGADEERTRTHLTHAHDLLDKPLLVTSEPLRAGIPAVPDLEVAVIDALKGRSPAASVHRGASGDLALLVLTSGSTGAAKAVMLTNDNLVASMRAKNHAHRLIASDVSMNWISFDHVAALLECHLLPLSVGASQVHVMPGTVLGDPLEFLRLISHHHITMTFTPNFLLGLLNAAADATPLGTDVDLSAVRQIISGGEAIVCATAARFLDTFAPHGLDRSALWPAFGMTETCAGCTYSPDFPKHDLGQTFANLGSAIPGLQVRITDDHDCPLLPGQVGHVQFTGPMVTSGYYHNVKATQDAYTADGWFRSGDLGHVDNGRLTLAGRSKDSVIINGVNYFCHELETALGRLEGVLPGSVAAVPMRPEGADTEHLAILFATTVDDADEAALHRLIIAVRNGAILHWGFRPSLVLPVAVTAIPKTSLGKIERARLRKRLEEGGFAARTAYVDALVQRQLGEYTAPHGATETTIAHVYSELFGLPADKISATAGFFDIGGTSLDIIRLKVALEERQVIANLPVAWIFNEPTVRALAALIDTGGPVEEARSYKALVTLQHTGDKTPLFCIHPGTGEVMLYVSLAKYFTHERPFHALRARGFGPSEAFFDSFDEMINSYAHAIHAEQPHGPYAIAGYSYGGVVAYEVAKRLECLGEQVGFVGVISHIPDTGPMMRRTSYLDNATSLAAYLGLISQTDKLRLRQSLKGQARQYQVAQIVAAGSLGRLAELNLDANGFGNWAALVYRLIELAGTYEPTGSVQRMTVFHEVVPDGAADDEQPWGWDEVSRWDEFSREPVRYVTVTGEHDILLGPRYIEAFQAVLRKEMDRYLPT